MYFLANSNAFRISCIRILGNLACSISLSNLRFNNALLYSYMADLKDCAENGVSLTDELGFSVVKCGQYFVMTRYSVVSKSQRW